MVADKDGADSSVLMLANQSLSFDVNDVTDFTSLPCTSISPERSSLSAGSQSGPSSFLPSSSLPSSSTCKPISSGEPPGTDTLTNNDSLPSSSSLPRKTAVVELLHPHVLFDDTIVVADDSESASSSSSTRSGSPEPLITPLVSPSGSGKTCSSRPLPPVTTARQEKIVAFEVFCGCARLAAALKEAGFKVFGIDYNQNEDNTATGIQIIWLDLTTEHGVKEFWALVELYKPLFIHFAPPCGTASRARDIRRHFTLPDGTTIDPKPLRSDEHPDGIPGLPSSDQQRVDSANKLYKFVAEAAFTLSKRGVAWTIENPAFSRMWLTSWFIQLLRNLGSAALPFADVSFDHCMHGGRRPKKSMLLHSSLDLSGLQSFCNHSKDFHLPWGLTKDSGSLFATAEERRYPVLLCKRLASRIALRLLPAKTSDPQAVSSSSDIVHAKGQQRRGIGKLVSEYCRIERNIIFAEHDLEQLKSDLGAKRGAYPVGTKVLREALILGKSGLKDSFEVDLGIGWSIADFTKTASTITHPLDRPIQLPPCVKGNLLYLATHSPAEVVAMRFNNIAWIKSKRLELADAEAKLHARLNPDVNSVVASKNILLFEFLLNEMHYDDLKVVELLKVGIRLTGTLERTGVWQPDDSRAAKASTESLWRNAKSIQHKMFSAERLPMKPEDLKLWDETLSDVADGNLLGPFSHEEVCAQVGPLYTAARRFAIFQKEKMRPIDDFSASGLNGTFGTREKAVMKGLDQTVAFVRAWSHSCSDRVVNLHGTDGSSDSVPLHPEWTESDWVDLVGRVADLKKAYKQLPAHPADRAFSLVGVRDPEGKFKLFRALSLMFGATAAVYSFLRFSRALSAVGAYWLRLVTIEFFDDFTQVEPVSTSSSARESFVSLLEELGWQVSLGEKDLPFAKRFACLGVEIDLAKVGSREVEICNKIGRVKSITEDLQKFIDGVQPVGFKEALSIRGRLTYAEGQTFGRVLAPTSRVLSKWVQRRSTAPVDEELKRALIHARDYLASAGPRQLRPQCTEPPVIIFTDGACETSTTIGGVLVFKDLVQCFGAVVPDSVVSSWKTKLDQEQVIGQAEIFPVLVARLTWQHLLKGRRCIFFLDNESARIALVRSYSPVLPSLNILMEVTSWDYKHSVDPWYARVPTCANISDGPSRMSLDEMSIFNTYSVVAPVFPGEQPVEFLR